MQPDKMAIPDGVAFLQGPGAVNEMSIISLSWYGMRSPLGYFICAAGAALRSAVYSLQDFTQKRVM